LSSRAGKSGSASSNRYWRKRPPRLLIAPVSSNPSRPLLQPNTRLRYDASLIQKCRYWTLGLECPFREQCCFAHGSNELRNKQHLPRNYRTKVCANFQRTGCCKYGERCQFLHPAAKPIALRRPSSISVSYADVLERMVEQPISSPAIPVR